MARELPRSYVEPMRTDIEARLLTVEEFERLADEPGCRMELVRGRVAREPPAGFDHSEIAVNVAALLRAFVGAAGAGSVVGADCGFVLFDEPPTVRSPDAAFVREGRLGPRTVTTYRSRDEIRLLAENDELHGADVLPGFRVKVSDLFGR